MDETLLAGAYEFFLHYYRDHKLDFTYAYDGVLEALAALRDLHDAPGGPPRVMAVLTNKPVRPARDICEAWAWRLLSPHLRGRQLPGQEARPGGPARPDGGGRRAAGRDGDDRRQPGGRVDGAQRRSVVGRLHFGFGRKPCLPPSLTFSSTGREWTAALTPRKSMRI